MSSPSVVFVLGKPLHDARPQSTERILLVFFGAGFTASAALAEFC